jgi:hypothetical protein
MLCEQAIGVNRFARRANQFDHFSLLCAGKRNVRPNEAGPNRPCFKRGTRPKLMSACAKTRSLGASPCNTDRYS